MRFCSYILADNKKRTIAFVLLCIQNIEKIVSATALLVQLQVHLQKGHSSSKLEKIHVNMTCAMCISDL